MLHLVILGGGSAAFAAASKARSLGSRVTIVNSRLPIGGCCVNVGCVPSKATLRAAEAVHNANQASKFSGVSGSGKLYDFEALWTQKRELVESLRQSKYADIVDRDEHIRYVEGKAEIEGKNSVLVDGLTHIPADRILVATGTRPSVPPIPGLGDGPFLTHESAFELKSLPVSLVVLGGGYVGVELAQMFARLGSKVTIVQRSTVLKVVDDDVAQKLVHYLQAEGVQVREHTAVEQVVWSADGSVTVHTNAENIHASHLLVATGRTPNTDDLIAAGGPELTFDGHGFLKVNDHLETNVQGIYGAGDVLGRNLFVYTAAHEGSVAASNALRKDISSPTSVNYSPLPWVVFTDPQVAGVGIGEKEASLLSIAVDVSVVPLTSVPRSLAARETRGFVKLLRDRSSKKIVGAQVLASEGSELLMEVSMAIRFGATSLDLAEMLHPYLTLSEAIKMAAIGFDHDVEKLSCCSSL